MSQGPYTFLFTGGGTAGHVVPALPVAAALRADGHRVHWIGSRSGLEERLVTDQVNSYHGIAAGKLRRYWSLKNFIDLLRVALGVLQALLLVPRLRPQAVFSKGGFVSFPVVLAAWIWRVPVVAHESDRSPGLANRLAYPFLRALCTNFPEVPTRFKGQVEHTGTPLRAALREGNAAAGQQFLFADTPADDRPLLLFTGGSLGADVLNAAVWEALPTLLARYRIVHLCGAGKEPDLAQLVAQGLDIANGYRCYPFLGEPWGHVLAAADLVVSRAGANSLFELLELRKPTLFVPLSRAVSRGDQIENAAYAQGQGLAQVLDEAALTPERLAAAVAALAEAAPTLIARLERLERPPATERISAMLLHFAAR